MNRIDGYRDLTTREVALINRVKQAQQATLELAREVVDTDGVDLTWAHQACLTLETGYMMLVRSIARPASPFDEPAAAVPADEGSLDDPVGDDPAADAATGPTPVASPTRSRM